MSDSAPDGDRTESLLARVVAPFVDRSVAERLVISVAAILLSIVVGFALVLVSGRIAQCSTAAWTMPLTGIGFCYDPIEVYVVLFNGALGYPFAVGDPGLFNPAWTPFNLSFGLTLSETTLLIFTGLSVAVAFRAGLFNIGTQGQLVVGALSTALSVLALAPLLPAGPVAGAVLIVVGTAAGAVGGGLWGAIPGALKAYADANEVITTIMLNFVAANVAYVLVLEVFRAEGSSVVATRYVPEYAQFPSVLFPSSTDFALLALAGGIAFIGALYYFVEHTSLGYDLRTSGVQAAAAEYGGVNAKLTTVRAMTLSGALGGIGGAVWVLMSEGRWMASIPDLGFDGITVSILAGNNPIGVLPAAFLFGVLKGGALEIGFRTDVPTELVAVLRGLIILFVAMPEFFRMIGRYTGVGGTAGGPGGAASAESDASAGGDGGEADA
ncbi:ABC transporter permease [Halorubrum ezzemoulense]|uniref:ABC transporter permease n=1 Tax=Halorubrum ezzemoulense TaxID=337243 RepID=UPI00232D68A7|nr:ABC transporter permease [Halorubrum ezzemoulense]MDB9251920.1 ABC transporter permease [Halorubrum ezzemoulense]MDB9254554.1 ABC transporter permease [Halorubrum ezzemoulense]MDB9275265.1 ABC transporter permease [Halorubrum ezzemoulense]